MDVSLIILVIAVLVGLYSAVNIGANDVANSMATSVASGALTIKKAVFVAAVFDVLGAILVGAHVANTIRKGLVNPLHFVETPNLFLYGMLAAVLGSAIWVNIATYFKLPVSTTHSIVGGVLGFGLVSVGFAGIHWNIVIYIVLSWIISPVFGGLVSYVIFTIIRKSILESRSPIEKAKRIGPFFVGMVVFVLVMAIICKGLKNLHLDFSFLESFFISCTAGAAAYFVGYILIRRYKEKQTDPYYQVEQMTIPLQVLTASVKAFSHGANDVANAVGPVAAIVVVLRTHEVSMQVPVPIWLLIVGGLGIGFGAYIWGHRVIKTVGEKITLITPTRGFAAEFGTAVSVLICTHLGMPVSTTHVSIGNIIGVGLARGISAIDLNVIKKIFAAWVISVPVAGLFSAALYGFFIFLFGT